MDIIISANEKILFLTHRIQTNLLLNMTESEYLAWFQKIMEERTEDERKY